jgi:LmbE family N-acetylglucosaminyl deacetylase
MRRSRSGPEVGKADVPARTMIRWTTIFALGAAVTAGRPGLERTYQPPSGPAILEELRAFNVLGTLLYVGAHPDDENTELITFGAKGRHYRTAYLSITRGDGGQNVLGPELDEALGLIRTQELLAARRLDGGRQFFTRAIDFGYSKSPDETLEIWDHDEVLGDVVRVIRTFRPDVVVTRFSPEPSNTHGHHTASAVLALEAFRLAGDPAAYPEQLTTLDPWQPTRILQNRGGRGPSPGDGLSVRVDGQDPVTGESFGAIAGQSRAMHRSQGLGWFRGREGERFEAFTLLDGQPASEDFFDGIDTTWGRVTGGAEIGTMTAAVIDAFDSENPAASVPALLEIRSRLVSLLGQQDPNPLIVEERADLDRIIQHCIGLSVETTADSTDVVPGEAVQLHYSVILDSDVVPVEWVRGTGMINRDPMTLQPGQVLTLQSSVVVPDDAPLSQPYWLREPSATGIYRVTQPALIGMPENPAPITADLFFSIGGQRFDISTEPIHIAETGTGVQSRTKLQIVAPISLEFSSSVSLFVPGASREVQVVATAKRPVIDGVLRLDVPEGWRVEPVSRSIEFARAGEKSEYTFSVTAPARPEKGAITASVEVSGRHYSTGYTPIRYEHIPAQLLQPQARVTAVSLELEKRGQRVGYIPGAGDRIAEALTEMGYEVATIEASEITAERLVGLDAVVIGIRAFETQDVLEPKVPVLFDYVAAGGTVVTQYNREDGLESAPLPLRISRDRVTREDAPVTFLAPDHPALNTPNKITPVDFDGWVQERSIYVPMQWDDAYVPILTANDPGEEPLNGQLLVAKYGAGYFVYTGLVFFRELPAGVPGAYRLFANLVSLGK